MQDNFFHLFSLLFVYLALVFEDLNFHLGLFPHLFVVLGLLVQFSYFAFSLLHFAEFFQQVFILLFEICIFLFRDLSYALIPRDSFPVHCAIITGTNAVASLAVYFTFISIRPSGRNWKFSFFGRSKTNQQVICVSSTANGWVKICLLVFHVTLRSLWL